MFDQATLRRCGRCGAMKSLDEFAWRRKARGQRDNYCRPCRRAYHREHYAANRQRYIDNAAQHKAERSSQRIQLLLDYLREHPCADCGETDPIVLEFDHREGKLFDIGRKWRDLRWSTVLVEIAKCDVVCANCHRRRTAHQRKYLRAAVAQR